MQATSRILDTVSQQDRQAILQHANAAQLEYEDEYDDSYDDLAAFGTDGLADAEGTQSNLVFICLLEHYSLIYCTVNPFSEPPLIV